MAEVFATVASGVSIADVAIRLVTYLKDVKHAAGVIEDDIELLISEIETLQAVHTRLEQEFEGHVRNEGLSPKKKILWSHVGKTLKDGQALTRRLDACVRDVYRKDPKAKGKRDGLIKQHRKRSRDSSLSELRDQIHTYAANIRQEETSDFLKQVKSAVGDLNKRIEDSKSLHPRSDPSPELSRQVDFNDASISALERIASSVRAVEQSLTQASANKFFDIPQLVDPFYTGREQEAAKLSAWMFQPQALGENPKQRRFVIHGIGGSGKTQFCCKFADDNRECHRLLKQTLSQNVARVAEVDANDNAALHWLANLEKRWLLIIDNADDSKIKLDDYFPKCNRGHVLITTRNPFNKSYGNVGPGFFEFHGLDNDAAKSLLLLAAGQSQPWDATVTRWASKISKARGYLALAIAVAGASILEGFCQFHEYLDYYEEQRKRRPVRMRSRSPTKVRETDETKSGSVEATFDISYKTIADRDGQDAKDALQLLKMFAFLHYENIRFEFLEKAVKNGAVQSRQQAEDRRRADEMKAVSKQQTWSMWSSDLLFTVLTYLYRNRGLPALPDVLRTGRRECHFDKFRVRAAMRQLTQCSLVIYNHEKDSYSMHPLVHKWAREAPEMTFGEQSIWAEAAGVLLSCCILLPPLGTSTKDEELRKDLLPHVDHVRDSQAQIEQSIRDKRMARMKPWPIFETGFNRERALVYAKFSVVYAQNGRWEDAKRLQLAVKEFTMKVLGLRHLTTRRIHLALAGTLLYLGESNEAALLQERVVAACEEFLGPDHRETLVAKESLGESRWLQGRLSDAKKLQEEAVAGLQKQHGLDDEDTLNAIDYLGRTVSKFYRDEDIQRARDLHQTAIDGMRRVHGSDRLRTLIACENLCCVAVLAGQTDQLLEAHEMMNSVLNIRKTKLGKEHGYTLHAMVNLALVKKGLGDLSGAEELILTGLPIAERNLGANHIAYLWGRHNLGLVWIQQERWDEAESLFFDVIERQKVLLQGRGRYHPDRVIGLVQLAAVYNALGKHKQRDAAAEEAMRMMDVICTEEHRVAKKLKADMEMWKRQRMTTSSDPAAT